MLAGRKVPPRKIPRGESADGYFCLAIQYVMLGRLGLALKATTKAVSGHSKLGRKFWEIWTDRNGHGSTASRDLNKGQYFLVSVALSCADILVSFVVPVIKWLWSSASATYNISRLFEKPKTTDNDINALPGAVARVVVPDGLTPEAYLELGKKYKQNGWIGQSQQALRRAETLSPANSPTALASHNYLKTKVPHAEVSLEVELQNLNGYHAMSQGNLPKCKEIFEKLMQEYPDFEWPYLNLATAYMRDMQLDEAKFLLRKLLSVNPDHVEAWSSLARIHAATFELDDAHQALAHARSLYNDDDDSQLGTMVECLEVLDKESNS